jgi:hypothetical protein
MQLTFILVPGFVANPGVVASMSDKLVKLVWKRIYGCPKWSAWVICRNAGESGIPVMLAQIDVSDYSSCIDAMLEKNQLITVKVLQTLTEIMGIRRGTDWILKLGSPLYVYSKRL